MIIYVIFLLYVRLNHSIFALINITSSHPFIILFHFYNNNSSFQFLLSANINHRLNQKTLQIKNRLGLTNKKVIFFESKQLNQIRIYHLYTFLIILPGVLQYYVYEVNKTWSFLVNFILYANLILN